MFRYALLRHPVRMRELYSGAGGVLHKDLRPDGSVVGYIDGHPIAAAVVDDAGHRYSFAGVAPRRPDGDYDVQALRRGEWIVEPGLVYG